ncbi:hypothetical protein [Helicobacter pylori]|uniref:hypothetical protein n=1 Tax=Helicobacter pylori TaxID=210 RepID=UPI001E40C622|nr:hypothetical protein [Helicobacter pylori]
MASFKALGNLIPKMRSGAFLYSVPSVNLVHWYFKAPLRVVAKPWLKFLVLIFDWSRAFSYFKKANQKYPLRIKC